MLCTGGTNNNHTGWEVQIIMYERTICYCIMTNDFFYRTPWWKGMIETGVGKRCYYMPVNLNLIGSLHCSILLISQYSPQFSWGYMFLFTFGYTQHHSTAWVWWAGLARLNWLICFLCCLRSSRWMHVGYNLTLHIGQSSKG